LLRELARPPRAAAQQFHDAPALGICEGGKRAVQAGSLRHQSQFVALIFTPIARSASSRDTSFTNWAKVQT